MPLTPQVAKVISKIVLLLETMSREDAGLILTMLQESPFAPTHGTSKSFKQGFNGASNGASTRASKGTSKSKIEVPFEGDSEVLLNFFSKFWFEYPRKQDKQETRRLYNKLLPDKQMQDRILQALLLDKASEQWTRDEGRFIPLPSTWLRRRRFDDEGVEVQALKFKSQSQRLWDEGEREAARRKESV